MSDTVSVQLYGFAAATASVDPDEWRAMSRTEQRDWAAEQFKRNATPTDVQSVVIESEELNEDRDL